MRGTMSGRRNLQELVQDAGITPILVRQPCLPAPSQPAIVASEEDHLQARNLLVEQRRNNPEYRDPSKQLKRIFRSSKEKERLQDTNQWLFSQDEIDHALSAVVNKPTTSPGLIQAFLSLGAKVNFVETEDQKKSKGNKPNTSLRRRSTVLQQAATLRRADSVSLLASSGADQTTLDEGLKAALAANDQSCIQELLRHGADINKFPNSLADAVRSNDQNLVRLFLRAPKALRTEIISSCLPAAVQHKSEAIVSLLIGYGADPNFNGASALTMAISTREYRLAVALVAGSIPLTPVSLQALLEPAMRMPTAQELYQFLQLLLCCGLSPASHGLAGLLIAASKRHDTPLALLLLSYGVSTELNQSECLRIAIAQSNWALADAILATHVPAAHASVALAIIPVEAPKEDRFRIISALVRNGATGSPLGRWLVRAVEEGDSPLMDLLLRVGAPLDSGNNKPLQAAVARKDMRSLRALLKAQPSAPALSQLFSLIRSGYSPSERLEIARLLLEHGAKGPEVDQALIEAVADTSSARDVALITELVRNGANINHNDGQAVSLAVQQADMAILRLLCNFKPTAHSTSTALPLSFDSHGSRRRETGQVFELLLPFGLEEEPALRALRAATQGGYENIDLIHSLIKANARLIGPAFQDAIALESVSKKAPILDQLLTMGIPQEALDKALAAETRHVVSNTDFSILKLLLKHGASVNYEDGESLSIGVASGNSQLTTLLLSGKDSPSSATTTKAFRTLFHTDNQRNKRTNQHSRVDIAQELLSRGVEQLAIDAALRTSLDPTNKDSSVEAMVDLLLQYHANANTADGACFVFSAQREDWRMLDRLLSHGPYFSIIVPALIVAGLEERVLIKSVHACFERGCTSEHLDAGYHGPHKEPLVVSTLQHYPRNDTLIKIFLDHGCNPDVAVRDTVEPLEGEESVSALIWALTQPQKRISSSVILALLDAGASPTRPSPVSEIAPIAFAAREGRQDIVHVLLERGADASARDKWNRSALFYASSTAVTPIVQSLSAHALQNDGSLHEAARNLQLEVASILVKHGHNPNFPSRLHSGRNALGELCLAAGVTDGAQRTKLRQLIRLFLDNGANPKFKARNERSAVILALDNPHNSLEVTEALLETEVWEQLNDEQHMFRDATGLWYSPLKYVELVASPSRAAHKQQLIDVLCDKGSEPKYYSEGADQPDGAIGLPEPIARLADRQKEHELSIKHAKEVHDHTRSLEETSHRDQLRRKREQQDAELALKTAEQQHQQHLSQKTHEFEMGRVRSAEQMKRSEKVAWHNLLMEQERDTAAQQQQVADRKAGAAYAHEAKLIEQRKSEVEHRAGVERRVLKEKEDLFERNVKRQMALTQRVDESAELHARLRQERPAIEEPKWGSVD